MTETGNLCAADGCYGDGYEEYCAFCPLCWSNMSAAKRRLLVECRVPPAPTIVQQHQHLHPPQSRVVTTLIALAGGVAGAAAFLAAAVALGLLKSH